MASAKPLPKAAPKGWSGGTMGSIGLKCKWNNETAQSHATGINTATSKATENQPAI